MILEMNIKKYKETKQMELILLILKGTHIPYRFQGYLPSTGIPQPLGRLPASIRQDLIRYKSINNLDKRSKKCRSRRLLDRNHF